MADKVLLKGKRVLLVDDEPDVLDTLQELLPMCETVKASDFKTAKHYLETQYFDMTVLDIMGVQGFQLLELANQRGVTAVMLTAHALSPDTVVKSYKEGATSYLPKEEMVNIASFLNDVLEAKEQGKSPWVRWYDRLGSFFEKKFGENRQKDDAEFWKKFHFY
jgi:DNA-binding NtrC family response regulator